MVQSLSSQQSVKIQDWLTVKKHRIRRRFSIFDKRISDQTFYLSQAALLGGGLIYIFTLFFIVNHPFATNNSSRVLSLATSRMNLTLELTNPDENEINYNQKISVEGRTTPNTSVVISLNDKDYFATSNLLGEFSQSVTLQEGLNQIIVTSIDPEGHSKSVTRQIYYSMEKV